MFLNNNISLAPMITYQPLLNEQERLNALNSYQILDTLPEQDYDDVTALAAQICQTPISLINLIDKNRQVFKSAYGSDLKETAREVSVCEHSFINPYEPLTISDLRQDKRFQDNPYVKEDPNFIFYAGIPLVTPEGHPIGTLCVLDMKSRTLTDDQLKALTILARQVMIMLELRKKNKALAFTQKQIIAKNAELEQFAYAASHDLKEPLRMVRSFLQLLEKKYKAILDDKGQKYIHYAVDGAKRMENLINELLEYSRIDQMMGSYEEVDVNLVIENVIELNKSQIINKRAIIRYDPLPTVTASKTPLFQVFNNLIGNGLKYHLHGQNPKIDISWEEKPLFWEFAVTDEGRGVDPAYALEIFQPFRRLFPKEEIPGTGMGLAICKKIIEKLGGEIWVSTAVKSESRFHFTIPKTPMSN